MAGQVDEIKARVDIIELISEYIRLKPAGTNNWKGLCPFHNEKTPSFMVSKDKQIWHCFGCSEGGDIFTFVQKMEGIEFPEALRLLAQKAGVHLAAADPQLLSQRNTLLDICQWATHYWHKTLLEAREAQKARDYLRQRQVKDSTIAEFKIGYAPPAWEAAIKFLQAKGFSEQEIFLAGLGVKKERGSGFYERFRDRLMFPINDLHGAPIGFSGRTLDPQEPGGKYINTPQTLIYNKSLLLFNLDKAKNDIKKEDLAIIVEGQMDAVSVYQAGSHNVIATSGTALTIDQIKILKRYSSNLAIAFDTDVAGESAAKRGIDLILSEEMNVRVIVLPQGKDPDECVKASPKLWFEAVKDARSIMEYYFEKTFSQMDIGKVEGKKAAAKILLPVIFKIGNKIEQSYWLQKLGAALGVSERILREMLMQQPGVKGKAAPAAAAAAAPDRDLMLAERLLAMALKYPALLDNIIDRLPPEMVGFPDLHALYKELIIYYTIDINHRFKDFGYQDFSRKVERRNLDGLADKLVLLAEKDFFDFNPDVLREEALKVVSLIKMSYLQRQAKGLEEEIRLLESQGAAKEAAEKARQLDEILSRRNQLTSDR